MKKAKKTKSGMKFKYYNQLVASTDKWCIDRKIKKFIKSMQCQNCPHSWVMTSKKGWLGSTALPLIVKCPKCKSGDVRFKDENNKSTK